ncbi:MAG: hypothetical protein JXQ66_02180 [Campylobacterales bacterium]|nr:hypothetical protein [Campylobacterales bacterium]
MFRLALVLSFFVLFFSGCESKVEIKKKCRIVCSNWIGYSPLLYAYEKGDLDSLNVEIIVTNSLQSSLLMFEKNNYDGLCSTQVEVDIINENRDRNRQISPIFIFDRSYGGDVILSNITKDKLLEDRYKNINVYMEQESVNFILFSALSSLKNWNAYFNVLNMNQYNIAKLKHDINKTDTPSIIITYEPYATKLKEQGLYEIESTKNDNFLVFDFLSFVDGKLTDDEMRKIQKIIFEATRKLNEDPKEIYNTVKDYFEEISYDEFKKSLDGVLFMDDDKKDSFIKLIQDNKICKNDICLKEI